MNPLGVHALVWVGDWSEPSARHALRSTAETGFDLIEVPVLDPDSIDIPMTRALLEEHGLHATCSLGLTFDADISSADDVVARRGQERLEAALGVARGIGASYLGGVIYSALGKYGEPATAAGRSNCVAGLRELARRAADDDITLGLEVVNRYESNVLNVADQALEMLADIGEDNVVLHLDTYHMAIEEQDLETPVVQSADHLGYVHVGESHRGYLGTGTIDFVPFFGALRRIGYTGPITFESFSSAVVSEELSNTLAVWRNLWNDSTDLATQARDFVRTHLAAHHPA